MNAIAFAVHVLAAIVWVGGMFFAYLCLRPAAGQVLEPSQRLPLLAGAMGRFFGWVWAAIVLLPATGLLIAVSRWGGMGGWPHHVLGMFVLGLVMILAFLHLFFAPWRRLRAALTRADLPAAGQAMNQLRIIVAVNLALGLLVSALASAGRYL